MKIKKICITCNKTFLVKPCKNKAKFCSRACYGKSLIGKHHSSKTEFKKGNIPSNKGQPCSEKTKEKIRKKNKGKHFSSNTEFKKGQKGLGLYKRSKETKEKIRLSRLGKKASEISKEKMSLSHLGKPGYWTGKKRLDNTGDKHPNYKGGITPENRKIRNGTDIKWWREAVFARDDWTCQKYKIKGGIILQCHHIKGFADFPELRFITSNGITLSEKAHREFHKKYGRRNNTKEQLEEFLRE